MAERRMFSKRIVRSAKFLKMPVSSRELYWQLGIEADDDGIVESFNVMRMTGASEDDLRVLVSKGFVQVLNEDLVAYITDWNENNKLRADRKVDSIYKDLLIQINPNVQLLQAKPRADTKKLTGKNNEQTNGRPMDCIGKVSIVEVSEDKVKLIENSKEKEKKEYLSPLGEFENVLLTSNEYKKLQDKFSNYQDKIEDLSIYLKNNPKKKYESHYATLLAWHRKEQKEKETKALSNSSYGRKEIVPSWLNKEIKKEEISKAELQELEEALKEFQPDPELQERLKRKYGKGKQ